MNIKDIVKLSNYYYKLAAAPEFLKLKEQSGFSSNFWFGPEIAALNDDAKNFAILDNRIIKNINNINKNYYITDDVNSYYMQHPKTENLINFICQSYNKKFPQLNSQLVKEQLENQGLLGPHAESSGSSQPIFMLIHDLIHQVVENDFVEQLKNQEDEDGNSTITFMDQLNEDIASSLSNFQPNPNRSAQGLVHYLRSFYDKFFNEDKDKASEEKLKKVIEKTFYYAKAELRGKIEKIKNNLSQSYVAKSKEAPAEIKQLVDGILSKLKNYMISMIPHVLYNIDDIGYRKTYSSFWEAFESDFIFEDYNDKLLSTKLIKQEDSSALRSWMIECLQKMKELNDYFEFKLEDEIISEYSEEDLEEPEED